jgi:hypothetical protein
MAENVIVPKYTRALGLGFRVLWVLVLVPFLMTAPVRVPATVTCMTRL